MKRLMDVCMFLWCPGEAVAVLNGDNKKAGILRIKGSYKGGHCCIQRRGKSPACYWVCPVEAVAFYSGGFELTLRLSL